MKKILFWLFIVLGIISILFSAIYQAVLVYKKFGFILSGETNIIIPHWSLLFSVLGFVLIVVDYIFFSDSREIL